MPPTTQLFLITRIYHNLNTQMHKGEIRYSRVRYKRTQFTLYTNDKICKRTTPVLFILNTLQDIQGLQDECLRHCKLLFHAGNHFNFNTTCITSSFSTLGFLVAEPRSIPRLLLMLGLGRSSSTTSFWAGGAGFSLAPSSFTGGGGSLKKYDINLPLNLTKSQCITQLNGKGLYCIQNRRASSRGKISNLRVSTTNMNQILFRGIFNEESYQHEKEYRQRYC